MDRGLRKRKPAATEEATALLRQQQSGASVCEGTEARAPPKKRGRPPKNRSQATHVGSHDQARGFVPVPGGSGRGAPAIQPQQIQGLSDSGTVDSGVLPGQAVNGQFDFMPSSIPNMQLEGMTMTGLNAINVPNNTGNYSQTSAGNGANVRGNQMGAESQTERGSIIGIQGAQFLGRFRNSCGAVGANAGPVQMQAENGQAISGNQTAGYRCDQSWSGLGALPSQQEVSSAGQNALSMPNLHRPATVEWNTDSDLYNNSQRPQSSHPLGCPGQQGVVTSPPCGEFPTMTPLLTHQPGLVNAVSQIDSMASPLGMYVPQAIKDRVWKGEFVEFADLLPQNRPVVEMEQSLSTYLGSAAQANSLPLAVTSQLVGASLLSPSQGLQWGMGSDSRPAKKQITSIGEWTDAMLIFLALYTSRHPDKFMSMLKYTSIVREAAARFGIKGALDYDRRVRIKMAMDPRRRWDTIDGESYFFLLIPQALNARQNFGGGHKQNFGHSNAQNNSQSQSHIGQAPFRKNNTYNKFPPGVCWQFNKGNCNRQDCRYGHKCASCGHPHPQIRCYSNASKGKNKDSSSQRQKPN